MCDRDYDPQGQETVDELISSQEDINRIASLTMIRSLLSRVPDEHMDKLETMVEKMLSEQTG
ncbi:MAG: hypothetical protein AAF197_08205 [Pseudomonadota bacterium]